MYTLKSELLTFSSLFYSLDQIFHFLYQKFSLQEFLFSF